MAGFLRLALLTQLLQHSRLFLRASRKGVITTTILPRFDCRDSATLRPRYDHSTTYVTTGLLHCGLK